MRTLKFIVDGKTLTRDPACNFVGLFPSDNRQIEVEFSFLGEWERAAKVAAFYSVLGKEYPPQMINDRNRCVIPQEALKLPVFRMQVLGSFGGSLVSTNTISIYQRGGKA